MTVVALTAFVTVTDRDGNEHHTFQNGRHSHPTEGNKVDGYDYLSFLYQGAAMNRSGDNLEASIILANNPLSMSYVKDFVEQKYYIDVETWLMDDNFNKQPGKMLTKEYWLATGMRYDPEAIELLLSSAIDAVGAQVPQKTLSTEQCNQLPLTGTIQNR